MLTVILKIIFVLIATTAFNSFPSTPSPRYWNDSEFDSLMEVAAQRAEQKTDSALGVYTYLEEIENLKREIE